MRSGIALQWVAYGIGSNHLGEDGDRRSAVGREEAILGAGCGAAGRGGRSKVAGTVRWPGGVDPLQRPAVGAAPIGGIGHTVQHGAPLVEHHGIATVVQRIPIWRRDEGNIRKRRGKQRGISNEHRVVPWSEHRRGRGDGNRLVSVVRKRQGAQVDRAWRAVVELDKLVLRQGGGA